MICMKTNQCHASRIGFWPKNDGLSEARPSYAWKRAAGLPASAPQYQIDYFFTSRLLNKEK